MSRLLAVPRPTPLKVSLTPLSRLVQAQAAAIADRSPRKGRALAKFQQEILDDLDAADRAKAAAG
jgi:hypothetical protein